MPHDIALPALLQRLRPSRSRAAIVTLLLITLAAAGCSHKNVLGPERIGSASASATFARPASDEPVHLEGRSASGALWVIDKPARWNGALVVYMHGYVFPYLPATLPAIDAIRDSLLARGYALAASGYSRSGYAEEGVRETHELNLIFTSRVFPPRRTYLFGQSLGGLIEMILSQDEPHRYDGSLLVGGIVGGSDDEVQYLGDIRVLFDAVYPDTLPGDLEHPPVVTDVNRQVAGPVIAAIHANPQGLGIIQALARHPLPGNTPDEIVESLITVLSFDILGAKDLLARCGGDHFFDNANHVYASPALPQPLLDDINARVARYARGPQASEFLARFGEPAGAFSVPVMTLHTTRDPVVPYFHEGLLAQVAASPNLIQHGVDRYGHIRFTTGELMSQFDEMVRWSESRRKPIAGAHEREESRMAGTTR